MADGAQKTSILRTPLAGLQPRLLPATFTASQSVDSPMQCAAGGRSCGSLRSNSRSPCGGVHSAFTPLNTSSAVMLLLARLGLTPDAFIALLFTGYRGVESVSGHPVGTVGGGGGGHSQ